MASSLPTFDQYPDKYDVDADAALVQKGIYSTPAFYGDASMSSFTKMFMAGVNTALNYAGQTSRKNELVDERTEESGYRLTREEYKTLQKKALSISNFTKIPYDTCEDFLIILCFINNIDDMTTIADAVQISELANPNIIRQPMKILNLPGLEKINFAAQALDGIINLFRKYLTTAQNTPNTNNESTSSILGAISSLVGGFGGASLGPRMETNEMGNFLSELITGKRIPTNVIAKNPMMQSPSYTGKAFFGELPNAMSNVDIDQIFNKMIASFPKPSSGVGTTSFSMQNFGSFQSKMPLVGFVSKIITGSSTISSTRKQNQIQSVVDKINVFTGSNSTDDVEVTRADNVLPVMIATSTALSGYEKAVFSSSSFKDGWGLAQAVGAQLASTNPQFIEAARKFL